MTIWGRYLSSRLPGLTHPEGFKLFWRWKSRAGKPGRPPIEREIRDLIRRMSRENPTWGALWIVSELALLGHDVAEGTVAKYMVRHRNGHEDVTRLLVKHGADVNAKETAVGQATPQKPPTPSSRYFLTLRLTLLVVTPNARTMSGLCREVAAAANHYASFDAVAWLRIVPSSLPGQIR